MTPIRGSVTMELTFWSKLYLKTCILWATMSGMETDMPKMMKKLKWKVVK